MSVADIGCIFILLCMSYLIRSFPHPNEVDPAILPNEETEGQKGHQCALFWEWLRLFMGKTGFPVPALGMLLGLKM